MNEKEKLQEKVKAILLSHGIKMNVSGCGCCGSPWVHFEYKGEKIVGEMRDFNFEMVKEEEI